MFDLPYPDRPSVIRAKRSWTPRAARSRLGMLNRADMMQISSSKYASRGQSSAERRKEYYVAVEAARCRRQTTGRRVSN
jgi:hypothetical protein